MYILKIVLSFSFWIISLSVFSQIKNAGFDQLEKMGQDKALYWKFKPTEGYNYVLDNEVKHTGTYALKISSVSNNEGSFAPFSQVVPVVIENPKKITLIVYIKSEDVKTEASIWCQIWDRNDKTIGYSNLNENGITISGSNEWKKYSMSVVLDSNAKKILLGGYLKGAGNVWFDDFSLEEFNSEITDVSPDVEKYISDYLSLVQNNSIYSNEIDWPNLKKNVRSLAAGAKSISEAKLVIPYVITLLKSVGDKHTSINVDMTPKSQSTSSPELNYFNAKILSNNIGYISIPQFTSTDPAELERFATTIQEIIRSLDNKVPVIGWVVDLRNNNGGNMYPMIAGLGPLLDEGNLGFFIKDIDGQKNKKRWFYENGASGYDTQKYVKVNNPYKIRNPSIKIAVLIGSVTASSGEIVAASFIGKPNTRLFGSPTAGFTTGNEVFHLSDGTEIVLATSFIADRTQKIYRDKIAPDEFIDFRNIDGIIYDLGFKKVEKWLMTK